MDCTGQRIGHAGEKPTPSSETTMTTSSRRSIALQFLAVAFFVAVGCLTLVFVASLPIPKWLSIPLVLFGIVLVRVIAAPGPTLHIPFRPSRPQEGDR